MQTLLLNAWDFTKLKSNLFSSEKKNLLREIYGPNIYISARKLYLARHVSHIFLCMCKITSGCDRTFGCKKVKTCGDINS